MMVKDTERKRNRSSMNLNAGATIINPREYREKAYGGDINH